MMTINKVFGSDFIGLRLIGCIILGTLCSLVSRTARGEKTPSTEEQTKFFKMRNSKNNAILSILLKTGSPLSPTSNYGGSILYNPNDIVSYCLNTGTYNRAPKGTIPLAELSSYGLCTFLQLGDRGSTLTFGLNFNYYQLKKEKTSSGFFALLPSLGIRIESDAEIILHFEISKNLNARNNLQKRLGSAPTDITMLNSTRMEASLGLGIGI